MDMDTAALEQTRDVVDYRDFERGIYTTSIRKHAERRALDIIRKTKTGEVTVLEYDFDFDETASLYPDLKMKRFETICAEWALFVMFNRLRKDTEPPHEYDIVEGPVANDKMFRQFQLYESNRIKLKEFVGRIKYIEPTHQIAFCSERALDALLDYNEPVRYKIEALVADLTIALMQIRNLSKVEAMSMTYNSTVFAQLSDENNRLYRKTLIISVWKIVLNPNSITKLEPVTKIENE